MQRSSPPRRMISAWFRADVCGNRLQTAFLGWGVFEVAKYWIVFDYVSELFLERFHCPLSHLQSSV
ncbi:MAG: hypothetical protein CMM07_16820 [Rhodopirellula sp.]|nr:hypothetical protein [Rhodopirellula sp.]